MKAWTRPECVEAVEETLTGCVIHLASGKTLVSTDPYEDMIRNLAPGPTRKRWWQ